jgi:hypothetical protein
MELAIGLVLLVAGGLVLRHGRPSAGGRLAALVEREGTGTVISLVFTSLIGLGIVFITHALAAIFG